MTLGAPPDRALVGAALAHLLAALGCALLLDGGAAHKPVKFGISIAIFLGTMAWVVPALAVPPGVARVLASLLTATMVIEMVPIVLQAARGRGSHFNVATPGDAALGALMIGAIVVATLTMTAIAAVATMRPLGDPRTVDPLVATAWRSGLWLLLLAALSGFGMGGRMRHSVGGEDGGPGLPLVGWSTTHGDLRVSHFASLHALQVIPLVGAALARLPVPAWGRWSLLLTTIAGYGALCLVTLARALAGHPLLR